MPASGAPDSENTRLTITWSKQTDLALRSYLGSQGKKEADISRFIEEAVQWRIFHQTVREVREAFSEAPPGELQEMIDEAVEDVRAKRFRESAKRT